jgi:hypothetical protein
MNKKFTKLIAALALLVFIAPPMVGWGQTRDNGDTHEFSQSISVVLNNNASIPSINIAEQSYPVKKVTVVGSYNKTYNPAVTIAVSVGGTSWGSQQIGGSGNFSKDFTGTSTVGAIVVSFTNETGNGTGHGTFNVTKVILTEGSSGSDPTFNVTFDAGDGTFVGNEDFPTESNEVTAGTYSLPNATRANYTLLWSDGTDTYEAGDDYEVTEDVDFTAQWTESGGGSTTTEHVYNFAGANNFYTDANLTTHPSSGSNNNVGTIYYSDGSVFVASGTNRYFSSATSGYFMLGKTNAEITLPTFSGYKITQVKLHSSSGHSTSVAVSIVSGSNTASTAQTWSTQNNDYVYNIASDYQSSALSVKVTNNYNSQFTSITIVCEQLSTDPIINATNPEALAYNATGGEFGYSITNPTGASLNAASNSDWITNVDVDGTNSKVTFSTSTNTAYTQRTGTITLTYTGATDKVITITQNAAPTPTITADDVNILYDAASGSIMYEIENYVAGTMAATTDADWITDFNYDQADEIGEVGFTTTTNPSATIRTATVTLTYTYGGSEPATKNVTVTQAANPNAPGTQTTPYTVAQARAAIDAGTGVTSVYATGIVSENNYYSQNNGYITYFISDDGTTTSDQLEAFHGMSYNGDPFTSADDIQVGDVVVIYGNLTKYQQTYEFEAGNYIVSLTHKPAITTDAANNSLAIPNQILGSYDGTSFATLTVNGTNLTAGITLTLGTNSPFEMSADLDNWSSSITISLTNGSITNEEVAIRLKESLTSAQEYADNVTLTSTGADNVTVTLAGSVTNPTYTLTNLSDSDKGSITFSPASPVEANTVVSITPVANDAYVFNGTLTFYDAELEVIETVNNVSGTYNYTMPAYNVGVEAGFDAKPTYAVTCVYDEDLGLMTATPASAYEGQLVTLEYTAATGYRLTSIVITKTADGSATDITPVASGDNYTFNMPGYAVTATATFEEITEVTYDFTEIEDFSSWGGYAEHVVEYETATVTFASASRQTQTITNQPVTKGNPVIIVMKNGLTITNAAFVCTQWNDKAQTITLHYSTDGGVTFTSTGVTSTNFSISSSLPAGTNAVKITFSSTSNQVGIASATVNTQSTDTYTLTLGNLEHINEYFVFVNNENEPVEFENDEIEVYEGATVYVSVAEVEDCYLFNGINVVYGDNQKADTTKYDPMYYSFVMPAGDATLNFVTGEATHYTLTVAGSHFEFDNLLVGSASEVVTLDANNQAEICEQLNVEVDSLTIEEGYVLTSVTLAYGDETVDVTTNEGGLYAFQMPSSNATLTITTDLAPVADNYELFTGDLVEGDYLIVYNEKAMNNTVSSNRFQYEEVIATNNVIATADASIVWHIAPSGEYWTIYNAAVGKYAASGSDKQAQLLTDGEDDKSLWTVSVENNNTYEFINKAKTNNYKYLRNNGTYGFACYQTGTGGALSLYKKVEDTPVTETYELTINGYGDDNEVETGWNLIASPVATTPGEVENMLSNTYDLYRFNPNADKEWENYKNEEHQNDFSIVPGQGYLYANSGDGSNNNTVTLIFSGAPYDGEGAITLENAGWNLVGNPFNSNVIVDAEEFMIMNEAGSQIIPADANHSTIAPMQGIFVHANEEGESVTFIRPDGNVHPNSNPAVVMNLVQNRGNVIDRAIVRFGEGKAMPKFQLFENNTKLSIAQNGEDFSVVRSNGQGTMPVNFRANENGQYTLTVNPENVEMNYLHLIDNMTGADIDLLQTPSYSFNATTTDYESRFKLVFASDASTGSASDETFAFYSNGNWVINNAGNATLQVVDLMGRILSSETVNGSVSKTINATPGVYMLRLINGENVKVQKIVVR